MHALIEVPEDVTKQYGVGAVDKAQKKIVHVIELVCRRLIVVVEVWYSSIVLN